MTQDIGKTAIHTSSSKSQRASSKYTNEVKILQRGKYYLTPFLPHHIEEVLLNLSQENKRELKLLGHLDIEEALIEMYESSECYLARKEGESFLMVGGLWYNEDQDFPQMFSMFSKDFADHFVPIARGSKMLVNFFDKTQDMMSMTILSDYEFMVQWATWLGFEVVGVIESNSQKYVEFVRCNPNRKSVYDGTSRPVMH